MGWGTESLWGLSHMIKMATMPIYGKNLSKIFFPRTVKLMTLKLLVASGTLVSIIICSNDDSGSY